MIGGIEWEPLVCQANALPNGLSPSLSLWIAKVYTGLHTRQDDSSGEDMMSFPNGPPCLALNLCKFFPVLREGLVAKSSYQQV